MLTSNTPKLGAASTVPDLDPPVERCLSLLGEWSAQGSHWFEPEPIEAIAQTNQAALQHHLHTFRPQVCLAGNLDLLQRHAEVLEQILAHPVPVAHYIMNACPDYAAEFTPQQNYHLITCSDWVKRSLAKLDYPACNVQVIYPGGDVETFYQPHIPPQGHLKIAYASMVAHYKGVDVLIEALTLLQAVGVEFTATIAGGTFAPAFVDLIKQFVDAEGLQAQIHFAGELSRPQLKALYQTHNVLVFPSRFEEPFGISQIEAMAAGLTLVTSGTGGAREILESHGQDGLLFESENPMDLADALASLPADPVRWNAIARRGQARAVTQFSQAKAADQLEVLLQDLAGGREKPMALRARPHPHQLAGKLYPVGRAQLLLPLDHNLDQYQATWKRYDTALSYIAQAIFAKYPEATAIDIGANVGDSAALIRANSEMPVLCLEGHPEFVPYLQHNLEQLGDSEFEACFVGPDGTEVDVAQISSSGGTASLVQARATDGGGAGIRMQSLEQLVELHPRFNRSKLLKIDTDGFDFSILQSALAFIATHQPVLFFEYDITFTPDAKAQGIETLKALFHTGYQSFLIYDNFGNYLLSVSETDIAKLSDTFLDLTTYLCSNRSLSGTPAVYYFDICAFSDRDQDVFSAIRKQELELLSAI